jgi:hypothetical protein
MELFLNLLWLALVVPALLIWRQQSSSKILWHPRSFRAIVLLGCLLVLLFPVVSATDDLHPIHNEIEESSPSRRAVKQAQGPHSLGWASIVPPALPVATPSLNFGSEVCCSVSEGFSLAPERILALTVSDRAPPLS